MVVVEWQEKVLARAEEIIGAEHRAIEAAWRSVEGEAFCSVVKTLMQAKRVVVSGMGKVGHVGIRFAATLSSTGTSAVFLHPAEAAHGDLGVLQEDDILVALSNSGKTREVVEMVAGAKRLWPNLVVVVVAGDARSPLVRAGTLSLCYGKVKEPCPLGLTPTASSAVLSVLLDALALVLMEQKGFTAEAYARRHHAGYLGKKARGQSLQRYRKSSQAGRIKL